MPHQCRLNVASMSHQCALNPAWCSSAVALPLPYGCLILAVWFEFISLKIDFTEQSSKNTRRTHVLGLVVTKVLQTPKKIILKIKNPFDF